MKIPPQKSCRHVRGVGRSRVWRALHGKWACRVLHGRTEGLPSSGARSPMDCPGQEGSRPHLHLVAYLLCLESRGENSFSMTSDKALEAPGTYQARVTTATSPRPALPTQRAGHTAMGTLSALDKCTATRNELGLNSFKRNPAWKYLLMLPFLFAIKMEENH